MDFLSFLQVGFKNVCVGRDFGTSFWYLKLFTVWSGGATVLRISRHHFNHIYITAWFHKNRARHTFLSSVFTQRCGVACRMAAEDGETVARKCTQNFVWMKKMHFLLQLKKLKHEILNADSQNYMGGVGKHLSNELILAPTPLFVTLSCCVPRLILNWKFPPP